MSENERRQVSTLTKPSAVPSSGSPGTDASVSSVSGRGPQTGKPGRRRRAAEPKNKPSKNQHFYFVDQNSSSKEKRAHVMRHHVQEKRKQRKMSHGALSSEKPPNHIPSPMKEDAGTGQETQLELLTPTSRNSLDRESSKWEANSPAQVPSDSNPKPDDLALQIRFSSLKSHSHASLTIPIGSPITILDAFRRDPFSSLPIQYDNSDIELADYWRHKLSYWSGQNLHLKNQIFRTAMGHPLSFKAVVLSYCARWKAQLYNMADSSEIQRHVGEAVKLIDDASSGSASVKPDDLAMALGGMALHEGRFGSRQLAQLYVDRAVQLMRPRTGTNKPVEVFIHYVRYLMMPGSLRISLVEQQWLITFLRGAEDLMRRHSSPEYLANAPNRLGAFQMEGPLFALLSSGPRPSLVPHASRVYVVRDAHTQEVSRTAALIYITAALWDFQEFPTKTNRFLDYLSIAVKQHHLDREPSCETLLWVLLEEGFDSDLRDPERPWSTGELLKAHKQLRPDLQFQFNEILMNFLSFCVPVRGVNTFEEDLKNSLHRSQ
ncbi:hypothetical protein N7457_004023 [Penicillium paradoxum]|uniref:uncharacterized protein n=1 Tax=Penicillium paradoxum TaxID=176176 RepID=UPI002548E42C|nr:uncharacterized protein N7457_004023 [Penicillium paradoxum]KAJ5782249.1 hypothetical protein N7457_004023 [Penicillium paradoxum]